MGYTLNLLGTIFLIVFGSTSIYGFHISVMNLISNNFQAWIANTIHSKNLTFAQLANQSLLQETSFYLGLVNAIFIIGGMIGSFAGGFIGDLIGRKRGVLLINGIDMFGALTMFMCRYIHFSLIFIGRFISGLGCGVTLSIAFLYLMEIAPTSKRGIIGACGQLSVTIGILLGNVLTFDALFDKYNVFHFVFLAPCIPCLSSLILLPFCPESPRYLVIVKGNSEKASQAHSRLNNEETSEEFLKQIEQEQQNASKEPPFNFFKIFTSTYRIPLLLACLLQVMQQLSGINAVMTYSSIMIRAAGVVNPTIMQYFVAGVSIFNVLCTVVSLPLLDIFGRRTLTLWPSALLATSLAALTITVTLGDLLPNIKQIMAIVSVVIIFIYVAGFAFGLGCVPSIYVSEIFRQAPRGSAYSVSQALQWTSNLIVTFTYPLIAGPMKGFVFVPYLTVVVVIEIVLFFLMPETKNKSIDDIVTSLSGKAAPVENRTEAMEVPEQKPENEISEKNENIAE